MNNRLFELRDRAQKAEAERDNYEWHLRKREAEAQKAEAVVEAARQLDIAAMSDYDADLLRTARSALETAYDEPQDQGGVASGGGCGGRESSVPRPDAYDEPPTGEALT